MTAPTLHSAPSSDVERTDLDRLEQELDDVEVALACLSETSDQLCATCRGARVDGSLESRAALAACAKGKFPAEDQLEL